MLRIRRAEPDDAASLARLAERTFRAAFGTSTTPENVRLHCQRSYGEEIQTEEISDPLLETLVCTNGQKLVAYAQLDWRGAPPCGVAARSAEIRRLYVDAQWHGKGAAQLLVAELLRRAADGQAEEVWLGVWEDNPRAIAFYRKSGFVEVGEQVFPVGEDPQRDLVLSRPVAAASQAGGLRGVVGPGGENW